MLRISTHLKTDKNKLNQHAEPKVKTTFNQFQISSDQ